MRGEMVQVHVCGYKISELQLMILSYVFFFFDTSVICINVMSLIIRGCGNINNKTPELVAELVFIYL
jgi:hypothetical protein